MRPVRAAAAIVGILATLCAAGFARAQQPLIEYASISEQLFTSEDLAILDRAAGLNGSQRESVESLMRTSAAEGREVMRALDRRFAEKKDALESLKEQHLDKYNEAIEQLEKEYRAESLVCVHKVASIERKTLADARSTLTPEQDAKGWSDFERRRRREVLCAGCRHGGVKTDPAALVRGAKLSAADAQEAAKILDNYDVQVDAILIERMHLMDQFREESDKAGEVLWWSHRLHPAPFRQLNIRTAQAIEHALSDEGRETFLRYRVGIDYSAFGRASQNERIRKMVRLDTLTDDQRTRITEMVKQADARLFRMAVDMMRSCDREYMRADLVAEEDRFMEAVFTTTSGKTEAAFPPDPRTWMKVMFDAQAEAGKAVDDLVRRVRAVLTPEQREEVLLGKVAHSTDPFATIREDAKDSDWSTPSK